MALPVEIAQHDVFLSYHSADRTRVSAVRRLLSERGVRAFLDRNDLTAGLPWPQALEEALRSVRAVLVFVGGANDGERLGLWQRREAWFALDRQAQKEGQGEYFPVIPVLLPGARPDAGFLFLNTWVDIRDGSEDSAAVDAIVDAIRHATTRPVEIDRPTVCPYRALEAFCEEHAALYFGRESFAAELLDRVTHRSLIALVGPSGSGKSSVVQAGLIPLLRRQRPPQRAWDAVIFRPGGGPFHRLATSLIPLLEPEADEVDRLELGQKLGEKLAAGSVRIEDVVERLITKSNGTDRLLIVADQFEEIFTLTPAQQRQPFVASVVSALDRAPFAFLLSLRADFYGHAIALDRRLSDCIQSGLVNLGPMTRDELRRAVEQPAGKADIRFETGLVDRILDHVELQPGGLPLLEFALTQLWERREGRRITHAAYEAIGEVTGAISQRAESVFLTVDADQRRAALSLFTRLLRVSALNEAEPDTRRRVEVDILTESERSVLRPFIDARLLVLDREASTEKQTVEVAHEALIHGWRRLSEWVDQQRTFLLWRQRLGASLDEWERRGRDRSVLLRGSALKEAVGWARERKAELSQPETEFIGFSRRKERRRRGWRRGLIAFAIVIVGAWPGLKLAIKTNAFQVWGSAYLAPMKFPAVQPSSMAAWVHAMDVAGRLDAIGSAVIFQFLPPIQQRLWALLGAADIMAHQGRIEEAQRLAERALEVATQIPDFDSSVQAQLGMARLLSTVGRKEMAQLFALRALSLARQQQSPEFRGLALADAARGLASAGMEREAMTAIEEARIALSTIAFPPTSRIILDNLIADALVQVGKVDEALAIASSHSGSRAYLPMVQQLVDRGFLEHTRKLLRDSDDPSAVALLASAFASAGRPEEAKALTRRALALLEKAPIGPDERDEAWAKFHERLLLRVMRVSEAVANIRERGNPDELASFATVLARAGHTDLARKIAREAAALVDATASGDGPARVLVKVADALARSGEAKLALSTARAIKARDMQAAALGHAAYGFAAEGDKRRAQALVREASEVLPSIRDRDRQSFVWATVAMASVRLGRYAEALNDEGLALNPNDELVVYTAIIRDDALRRNGSLREIFDRGPSEGLGRVGLHWP
jgi:tetratricopeptide (TPR) repeat protein